MRRANAEFKPKEALVMADLGKIVDDLSKLTVLEAAELAKLLETKWGVSAAAAVAVAAGPPAGGGGGRGGRNRGCACLLAGGPRNEKHQLRGGPRPPRGAHEGER